MGIGGIGPNTGYTPLNLFVAQSDENMQRVASEFDQMIKQGYGAETAVEEALRRNKLTKWDFTSADWQRLSRHVENVASSRRSY